MSNNFGNHLAGKLRDNNPDGVPSAVGIAWFSRKTYDDCMRLFDDASDLHDTYEEWFQSADDTVKQLRSQGLKVVKAKIDPETFPAWCEENGITKLDKDARMAFANRMAMESIKPEITS